MLCCGYTLTDFPISIRLTSLALWQSNDCPSASKATLMNMEKYFMWIHYERLHNHNKAKHNKTVCIFLGIYCMALILYNNSLFSSLCMRTVDHVYTHMSVHTYVLVTHECALYIITLVSLHINDFMGCMQRKWNAQVKGQVTYMRRSKVKTHRQPLWHSLLYSNVWHDNGATTATNLCNHRDHFMIIGHRY